MPRLHGFLLKFSGPLALGLLAGCNGDRGGPSAGRPAVVHVGELRPEQEADVERFCALCHALPNPQSFPKHAWKGEVAQGYRFFRASESADGPAPPEEVTLAYFEARAPEALPIVGGESMPGGTPLFVPEPLPGTPSAAVANIRHFASRNEIWAPDMRTGLLLRGTPGRALEEFSRPVEITNPCRISCIDFEGDGRGRILVCDLGSFLPEDHNRGGVWLLDDDPAVPPTSIHLPAGRVADVQGADLDGDGDIDLVVAEFGWRRTGRIVVLWNEGGGAEGPWRPEILDHRHGAIDVPIVDINGDGRPDIIALISQGYELVVAYLNQGDGEFEEVELYAAGDPAFGSSGIQLVDFDGDGDLDVLHTSGDSFDSPHITPGHGVRWLENRGTFPFTAHELGPLPGAHRALAADVDLDGDLDVVAVSLLPPKPDNIQPGVPSVVWFEQRDGAFVRHVLELDHCDHASCELVDWDGDGDLDLLVTRFRWTEERGEAVTLFRNGTRSP
ncbi:MAG: VCBS repeat-containing protein [Planctomyces sp.]|nr:VCBS repeat-containing protein [Planctomyces sp.]